MNARRMLLDAFYELIQEHDFDDITVQMIIDRAQLSRGTFYRHYEDKYDLMNSFYRDNVESLLARVGKDADIREVIESILVHIEQNVKYYRKAVKTEGMDSFLDFLKEYSIEFYSVHYPQPQGADELAPEVYFEVEMLCGGHVAVLKSWIERNCPIPASTLARIAAEFIPATLRDAIDHGSTATQAI